MSKGEGNMFLERFVALLGAGTHSSRGGMGKKGEGKKKRQQWLIFKKSARGDSEKEQGNRKLVVKKKAHRKIFQKKKEAVTGLPPSGNKEPSPCRGRAGFGKRRRLFKRV